MANSFLQDGSGDKSLTRLLMTAIFTLDCIVIILSIAIQKDIPINCLDLIKNMNFIFGGVGLAKGGFENMDAFKNYFNKKNVE